MKHNELRSKILSLCREYATEAFRAQPFQAGISTVPPSGKVIGADEIEYMVDAVLDGWLTTGRFNAQFEQRLAGVMDVAYALTTNSGSSANLLALTALTSPLMGKRALRPGDEVITAAAGFPTTVNPILQNGLVPVLVDSDIPTYNPIVAEVEAAITPQTRAIVIAHTLGNPFAAEEMRSLADRHGLWLVEDCCDALGSTYRNRPVGSFGHVATVSFYPAHQITMGEGGALVTNDGTIRRAAESIRDWGRDCWCAPGNDNTCRKRFDRQFGELPQGYDHKYVYSHLGYNLKISDMQAACGLAQLGRLTEFIAGRRRNFQWLKDRLQSCEQHLVLPEATADSEPSWFGFPITIREQSGINRVELLRHLDRNKIGTRLLFSGNLARQPYMQGRNYRIAGSLANADRITSQTFWIGVYPGLTEEALAFAAESIEQFVLSNSGRQGG